MNIPPTWTLSIAALAVVVSACQRSDSDVHKRFDKIENQLAALTTAVKQQGPRDAARGPARRPERAKPNPEHTYSIPVDSSPIVGPDQALVTVVEAFEFACPYCEQSRPIMAKLRESYPKDVRIAYKHFLVHPNVAAIPAQAACAAQQQGKFEAMEALIWDKGFKAGRKLDAEHMKKLAAEAGLDVERFESQMNGADCRLRVAQDQKQLRQVGVGGTPAFYVNGRWVPSRSIAQFKALIDSELALAKERVAAGSSASSYYQDWVVARGRKAL